jgi:fatty acid desaturase
MEEESLSDVRARVRAVLPPEVFEPQPWRGVLAMVIIVAYCALAAALILFDPPWPVKLVGALLIGQGITSSSLIGHEILHGAVFRSRFWQDLIGGIAFAPYGFPVSFWRAWHVRAHHGHTNIAETDPDCIGFYRDLPKDRVLVLYADWLPGGRTLLTPLSALVTFTGQGMLSLWHLSPRLKVARGTLWRMRTTCIALFLAQVLLGVAMGVQNALFILVLPQLFANVTLMAYISTNHWLDPLVEGNDTLRNTSSVKTWRVFDYMHGWFSYHQEHHLFPGMSPVFARVVREKLREVAPEQLSVLPHLLALRWIYRSPRTYGRPDELLDGTRSFELTDIKREIAAGRAPGAA